MAKQAGFAQRATVKYGGGQGVMQAATNFANLYSNSLTSINVRDARQKEVFDKVTGAYQYDRDRLDKIPESKNLTLNNNVNSFLSKGADQIHQITNQMNNGTMSQADGTKYIAQLSGYLDQYEKLAPSLIAQAQFGLDAIQKGTASKQNSGDLQKLLMNVMDDNGNITLDEKDGMMYLTDTETGFALNLQEFERIASKEGSNIIATIPNLSGENGIGIDEEWNAVKDIIGLYEDVITTENGKETTTRTYDKDTVIKEMLRAGSFENLWKNEDAASIWYDLMHPEYEIGKFGKKKINISLLESGSNLSDAAEVELKKFDPSNPEQRKAMQEWAIKQSVDRNIPNEQVKSIQSDGSAEAWENSIRNQDNWSDATKKAKPIYDAINNVYEMLNDKSNTTDSSKIIEQLNSVGSKLGTTVEINDRGQFTIYNTPTGKDAIANEILSGDIKNPADILKMYNAYSVTEHLDQLGFGSDMQKNLQAKKRTYEPEKLKDLEDGVNKLTDKANPENIKYLVKNLGYGDIVNIESSFFKSKDVISIGDFEFEEDSLDWKQDLIDYLKGYIDTDPLDPNK